MNEQITWIDATKDLPDSDIEVLVELDSESHPVWIGYHDGENWRLPSGSVVTEQLTYWAEMPFGPKGLS